MNNINVARKREGTKQLWENNADNVQTFLNFE